MTDSLTENVISVEQQEWAKNFQRLSALHYRILLLANYFFDRGYLDEWERYRNRLDAIITEYIGGPGDCSKHSYAVYHVLLGSTSSYARRPNFAPDDMSTLFAALSVLEEELLAEVPGGCIFDIQEEVERETAEALAKALVYK